MTTLRHTPEKVDSVIKAVTLWDEHTRPSFIAWAVERDLEWLDAERANRRIIELELEVLRLQARLDAAAMREGEWDD